MITKVIIAIDGPAASGKGTLARQVADALEFAHMDTGLLYRAVGWLVLREGGKPENKETAIRAALALASQKNHPALQNQELRAETASEAAGKVAAIPEVRKILFDLQRSFAENPGPAYKGAVLDGRDIGTVICPDATVKLYVTASPETRAQRRLKELQSRGIEATYEAVLRDMRERDARDATRSSAPLMQAGDAVLLDTTDLDRGEALEQALEIIGERLNNA